MLPECTGSLDPSSLGPSFPHRRMLWRFVLAVGILGIIAFLVYGGLITLAMANYAGWGPQNAIVGIQAVPIVILGVLLSGPQRALEIWYLSAPVLALTLYSWFVLHRLGRERLSRAAKPPLDPANLT